MTLNKHEEKLYKRALKKRKRYSIIETTNEYGETCYRIKYRRFLFSLYVEEYTTMSWQPVEFKSVDEAKDAILHLLVNGSNTMLMGWRYEKKRF